MSARTSSSLLLKSNAPDYKTCTYSIALGLRCRAYNNIKCFMRSIITFSATFSLFFTTGALAAGFRHEADYSVDCLKKGVQCWWEIRENGKQEDGTKSFRYRFVVADGLDTKKVVCSLTGEGFADTLAVGKGLVAYMRPKEIEVHLREQPGNILFAFSPKGEDLGCKGANGVGDLHPIGD